MLSKKDNELQSEYIKRLVYGKLIDKTIDVDFEELSELVFGEGNSYNSSEVRKRFYGMKYLLEVLEKEKENGLLDTSDDKLLAEYTLKLQELKKEKFKIQTEKIELNRWLREQARLELFEEKILDSIKNIKSIQVPNYKIHKSNSDVEAILGFADCHYGKELKILGLEGEVLNEYSPEIFEKRMWRLLNRTIDRLEKEGLKNVKVFDLGDTLEGMLRVSQLMSLRYGVTDSIMEYGNFILSWLNELSKYVYVDYYQTQGNHNDLRLLTNKKGDFPHENTSRILGWFLEKMLVNNPNIKIHNTQNPMIYTKVAGFDILALHGQDDKNLEQSIKDYSHVYKKNIDFMIMGHLHSTYRQEVGINKEVIRLQSIIGIDDYSLHLKKSANAGASIILLEKSEGKVGDFPINLNII